MIRMGVNKAEAAMSKVFGTVLVLLGGLFVSTADAGFRSPESLVRNLYAYYGDRSSDLSSGLPRDSATASQFFEPNPTSRARMIRCGCFSHNTEIEQTLNRSRSLIGAAA